MTPSTWDVLPSDPRRAAALARRCGVPPLIGQLLLNRGVRGAGEARRFFSPQLSALADPFALPDMARAVA
ncbi:MAG: single-stranded-DNA-specific exonuclease RecJ, partial [Candidatus Omnitrophica bacterium]|nr:single-stranded-DNA-specific exonuclease RecJ [Candidatus Omnitrophota bacterium]